MFSVKICSLGRRKAYVRRGFLAVVQYFSVPLNGGDISQSDVRKACVSKWHDVSGSVCMTLQLIIYERNHSVIDLFFVSSLALLSHGCFPIRHTRA